MTFPFMLLTVGLIFMQKNLNIIMSLWIHSSALWEVEKLCFHVLSDPGNVSAIK